MDGAGPLPQRVGRYRSVRVARSLPLTKDQILLDVGGYTGADRDSWTDYLYTIFSWVVRPAASWRVRSLIVSVVGPLLVATILFYSLFAGLM